MFARENEASIIFCFSLLVNNTSFFIISSTFFDEASCFLIAISFVMWHSWRFISSKSYYFLFEIFTGSYPRFAFYSCAFKGFARPNLLIPFPPIEPTIFTNLFGLTLLSFKSISTSLILTLISISVRFFGETSFNNYSGVSTFNSSGYCSKKTRLSRESAID